MIYFLESDDDNNFPKLQVPIECFMIKDDILFKGKKLSSNDDSCFNITQLLVPASLVDTVLFHVHNFSQIGHPGRDRCLRQAQRSYYWTTIKKKFVIACCVNPVLSIISIHRCTQLTISHIHMHPGILYPSMYWSSHLLNVVSNVFLCF